MALDKPFSLTGTGRVSIRKKYTLPNETFGYTGASAGVQSNDNAIRSTLFTMGSVGGYGVSISANIRNGVAGRKSQCALYNSDKTPVKNGVTEEVALPELGSLTWRTWNFTTQPILLASTDYWIAHQTEDLEGTAGLAYQTNQSGKVRILDFYTYGTWPNPLVADTTTNSEACLLYCTYTPASLDIKPISVIK